MKIFFLKDDNRLLIQKGNIQNLELGNLVAFAGVGIDKRNAIVKA